MCTNANFYQQKAMEESNKEDFVSSGGEIFAYAKVLSLIKSLQEEQPEVDLEKEINNLDNVYFDLDGIAVVGATYYITVEDLKDIARHFFELGLNAKKK